MVTFADPSDVVTSPVPASSTTEATSRAGGRAGVGVGAAVLGGLVSETGFAIHSWWPGPVVGIAMLVVALRARSSLRHWAMLAFAWGLGFFLPHLWWAHEAVGVLPWLALSATEAALVALGGMAASLAMQRFRATRRPIVEAVAFGAVWTATEQLRQVWPFGGFPWGRLAFSQVDGPLLGLAPVGGAPLVSFTVAALGYLLAALAVDLFSGRWREALRRAAGVAAVVVATSFLPLPTAPEAGTIRVAAVQGNVPDRGLDAFAQARQVLDNHVAATRSLAADPVGEDLDLVLWPENASDVNPRVDDAAATSIDEAAAAVGAPILLGTDRLAAGVRYNDMVLWEAGAGATFAYSKQVPAPFGEYIPLRSFFGLFSSDVDRVRVDMAPGSDPALVPVVLGRLGRAVEVATPICFEVSYDAIVRDAVLSGAELLVVPTNNASFGYTAESVQQLAMSRFRAAEHGRAAVQISTVGVSGVVAPDGRLLERTELFTQDRMVAELPLRTTLTLSSRLGDLPTSSMVVLAVAFVLAGTRSRPSA